MRGTLHVMPAADALWLQRLDWELSGEKASARRLADLPHSPKRLLAALDKAVTAMDGRQALTREEFFVALGLRDGVEPEPSAECLAEPFAERPAEPSAGRPQASGVPGKRPGPSERSSAESPTPGVPERRPSLWGRQDAGWRASRFLLYHAVQSGTVVFGPTRGREHLMVLADGWITAPAELGREAALAELAARFVASHGPVSERDLARWSGRAMRDVRLGLSLAADEDRVVRVPGEDGAVWWVAPEVLDAPHPERHDDGRLGGAGGPGVAPERLDAPSGAPEVLDAPPSDLDWKGVRLLPAFDEHILGYADRTAQLAAQDEEPVCPGRNGVFRPTVVVDGAVVGTWSVPGPSALAKLPVDRPLPVTVTPFDPRRARKLKARALAAAAQEYARFQGWAKARVQ
jgi:hypothetical protein